MRDMVAAAQNNNLTELKTMFTNPDNHKKFDMNATAGETLVVSSVNGHSAVVEFLVSSGAFPNTQNGKALQRAALAQQKQTMQILLKYGADVNCRSAFAELTPLHYAAQTGNVSVVSLLVSHGAKVDLSSHPEHSGSECGWTALHFAADAGYVEVVRTLIGANCNLDARTAQDETAMTIAAEHGKWEVVKLLVVCGANIHATRRGLNVCEWAIYRAEADAVQFLVSYGAKPNLNARCLWFNPPHFTLKQICTRDFSEQVYEEIDLAIYRGGKQVKQRLEKRKLVSAVQWEHAPTFDPYSFDPLPPPTVCKFTDPIINLIIAYEM